MTSPSAFLYRYTPGSVGMVRIFAGKSIGMCLFYWMGGLCVVLQKWQMRPIFVNPVFAVRAAFARRLLLVACCALSAVWFADSKQVWAQAITPVQSDQSQQPQITKSPEGKKEEAERAAERAKAHHFDRVLIIVLENVDYERAIQDKNLASLAQHGASFTNFHAMFHPSYPNYLAMVAGTDFGIHRRGSFLGDKQLNFPNDAAHKTIADRLIASGLDFKQYAEEMPEGTCP